MNDPADDPQNDLDPVDAFSMLEVIGESHDAMLQRLRARTDAQVEYALRAIFDGYPIEEVAAKSGWKPPSPEPMRHPLGMVIFDPTEPAVREAFSHWICSGTVPTTNRRGEDQVSDPKDRYFMSMAIKLAKQAVEEGDRPFGCVVTRGGVTIGMGRGTETEIDPTRHSEMDAIREACFTLQTAKLPGCVLYSTHEPCMMCCGAIIHAKVGCVVWGSSRTDLPPLFRPYSTSIEARLLDTRNPPILKQGVMREECVALFDHEMAAVSR